MANKLSITDMYMLVLASLSADDKLALISKLSESLRGESTSGRIRPNLRTCFSGDWGDVSAEELRNHEYQGRTVKGW